MRDTDAIELAAMLCSRLCHDLLSPIGALNNGLELLAEERDPAMRARCIELLEQSARTSADKLKFFRLAFGAAGGFNESVPVEEPRALIEALAGSNSRVTLHWALTSSALLKDAVKVMLNLAQIGLEALVRGGTLDIGAEISDGQSEIVVRATGSRIAFDEEIGRALEGALDDAGLSSRTAAAHMLALLAEAKGGSLQYQRTDTTLLMGAVLPFGDGWIG
ncbi:histidine phosphotransferase [Erythrobacteraceae bacterium CFH 75059]|uniref:histidine phosphotransferase family protein n=1 Tax=Qipengyuania thermophila TaxID=2509361 RepID=UPI0010226F1F|nr:histidine phosphotransferase family protein [Qipengyuania thermophila]TCD02035.1 histidine phosphotransferase [Erythrobacteraceae bacterium CFH 75059]